MRWIAPLVVLLLLAGCVKSKDAPGTGDGGAAAGGNTTTTPPPPEVVDLTVATSAPYAYAPTTLSAPAGSTVNLTYTNNDPVPIQQHNWVLDEAGASTDVIGVGASDSVTFVAPAAGDYEFYCAVGNHRQLGMVGTFTST